MTRGQQLNRLLKLETQHGTGPRCGTCGLQHFEPGSVPPGRLTTEEVEARSLDLLGGERFANWPRCTACRHLVPLDTARELGLTT